MLNTSGHRAGGRIGRLFSPFCLSFGTTEMKRHNPAAWKFLFVSSLLVPALAVSSAGCGPKAVTPLDASTEDPVSNTPLTEMPIRDDSQPESSSETEETAETSEIEIFPAPQTEELFETIHIALTEAPAELIEGDALRQQIEAGLNAAEDLILRNSEPATVESAWNLKLRLLYHGARNGSGDYADQLESASRAVAETPFIRQAEYGHALCTGFRYFQLEIPVYEVAATLAGHARRFPHGRYSVRLFLMYARKLAEADRRDEAITVCRSALWKLHGHKEIGHVRSFLQQLEHRDFSGQTETQSDTSQNLILQQVAESQARLPIQVDDFTVLYEIVAADQMVIYRYTVTLERDEFDAAVEDIEETVSRNAWANPTTRKMLETGIRLKYDYYSEDEELLGSLIVR